MEGKNCALDIRLVRPDVKPLPGTTKVDVCAKKLLENHRSFPGTSQIVFCDISVPKEGFNVYDALKDELIRLGIPAEDIAFIHDGTNAKKRRQLLKDLDDGKIRIMIGSTQKLGTGVNVQTNLLAVHHLDVPWSPADIEQRNGRMDRPGNKNKKTKKYRYLGLDTFDVYLWQKIESKQRVIAAQLSGMMNPSHREIEDIAKTVLDFAEVKALIIGDMVIKRRVELANRLERLKIAKRQRRKELYRLQNLICELPAKIEQHKAYIDVLAGDIEYYRKHKVKVGDADRQSFGEELLEVLSLNSMASTGMIFDWYQGFEVVLSVHNPDEKPYVMLRREGGGSYKVVMDGDKPMGCSRRLDYTLNQLEVRKKRHEEKVEAMEKELNDAGEELAKGNSYAEQVRAAEDQLKQMDWEMMGK